MNITERYDKMLTGIISGFLLPLFAAFIYFLVAKEEQSLKEWLQRIITAGIVTHMISLSVFPNLVIFLLFNHFDMLRATRGVLGITIVWTILVFGIKILL